MEKWEREEGNSANATHEEGTTKDSGLSAVLPLPGDVRVVAANVVDHNNRHVPDGQAPYRLRAELLAEDNSC